MKVQPDQFNVQHVTAYDEYSISINGVKYQNSIIFSSTGELINWQCSDFNQLQSKDFDNIAKIATEVVILGVGKQLKFPHLSLLKPLIDKNIGYEVMTTNAACRTYNILAQEGRNVVCAIIL